MQGLKVWEGGLGSLDLLEAQGLSVVFGGGLNPYRLWGGTFFRKSLDRWGGNEYSCGQLWRRVEESGELRVQKRKSLVVGAVGFAFIGEPPMGDEAKSRGGRATASIARPQPS